MSRKAHRATTLLKMAPPTTPTVLEAKGRKTHSKMITQMTVTRLRPTRLAAYMLPSPLKITELKSKP